MYQVASKSKDAFLKFRKILDTCKKKVAKEMTFFFLEKPAELDCNRQFHQSYSFVLDIISTKLFKSANAISPKKKIPANMCTWNFVNKGIKNFCL